MRVYHTARPDPNATEYNVAPSGIAEAITKLAWMPDENIIVVGQRSGKVQLWDVRTASGPAISVVVSKGGAVIQDLEINHVHNTILLATDDRVSFISILFIPFVLLISFQKKVLTIPILLHLPGRVSQLVRPVHSQVLFYSLSYAF